MLQSNTHHVAILRQPAAAIAKNWKVKIGWRPEMVLFWNMSAAGRAGIAVDGVTAAGQLGLLPGDSNDGTQTFDQDHANGITFTDDGYELGSSANFRDNSAPLVFLALRGTLPVIDVTLAADITQESDDAFGSGEAYDIDEDGNTYSPVYSDTGVYRTN